MENSSAVFSKEVLKKYQDDNPFSKLNDLVYDCLEQAIVSLKIRPGERLNIARIAKEMNVSVTPIKNAINKLIENGLVVEKEDNSGYYVFDVGEEGLIDIFNMRKCQEGFASYLCAQRLGLVDTKEIIQLAKKYKVLWMHYADGDNSVANFEARKQADVDFHRTIVSNAGNSLLNDAYRILQAKTSYALLRTFEYWDKETDTSNRRVLAEQHIIIAKAIENGIADIARNAAEEHVQFALTRCILNRKI